jgi:hypothetical protein
VLALGQPGVVPYTLLLVNVLAVVGGTFVLGAWLRRHALSPWLALIYGLYPGLFVSVHRDLTEPLAYALVALAIYLFDFGGARRMIWAAIAFSGAMLTRESVIAFPLIYGAAVAFGGVGENWMSRLNANWRRASSLLLLSLAPFALYKIFLLLWLGSTGKRLGQLLTTVPFGGILSLHPWAPQQESEIFSVVLPGILALAVAARTLRNGGGREAWSLIVNVLIFVAFLNASSYLEYQAVGRITTGVVLAAVLCLPAADSRLKLPSYGNNRAWMWVASILWFLPWYALIPDFMGGS